jgi:hypothetical protein
MQYRHTHYSRNDGSPAMLVATLSAHELILENEDGYRWIGHPSNWLPYEDEVHTCPPTQGFHNPENDAPK